MLLQIHLFLSLKHILTYYNFVEKRHILADHNTSKTFVESSNKKIISTVKIRHVTQKSSVELLHNTVINAHCP